MENIKSKKITKSGEEFIRETIRKISVSKGEKSMLEGRNSYNLPFSDKIDEQIIWKANVFNLKGNVIQNNSQYADFIIESLNKNAENYNLDANILAAQCYAESLFKSWNYAKTSTASGISQFTMLTVYDGIYEKNFLNNDEKNLIIKNMVDPSLKTSWIGVDPKNSNENDKIRQRKNRTILFQNIIDNPNIMIKLQCALMRFIANRNDNLASSTLFAYNRGSGLRAESYVKLVEKTAKRFGNEYIVEGVKYVEKIFGFLGDKNNEFIKTLPNDVKGLSFGYKLDFNFDDLKPFTG